MHLRSLTHSLIVTAVLAVLSSGAATASAQDDVVYEADRTVHWATVLDDIALVASDRPRTRQDRIERVVDGEVLPARGLTGPGVLVDVERAGRRGGRVVVPFARARRLGAYGRPIGVRWYVYDVEADEASALRGLPRGAGAPTNVAIWRGRTVYAVLRGRTAGVHLREDGRSRRISKLRPAEVQEPLVLRGDDLALIAERNGRRSLHRLLVDGEVRAERLEPSLSDSDHPYTVHGAWIAGGRLNWFMESSGAGGYLVLATDLSGGGPVGAYEPTFERPLAFDGGHRYTTDDRRVLRRAAGEPSVAPPPNDAVADAIELELGGFVGARIGYATRTADEPPVTGPSTTGGTTAASRTVWYSYRPVTATKVGLIAYTEEHLGGTLAGGALAVYDDPGTGTLTPVPTQPAEVGTGASFDADPSHRYLIGLGADTPGAAWPTFTVRLFER